VDEQQFTEVTLLSAPAVGFFPSSEFSLVNFSDTMLPSDPPAIGAEEEEEEAKLMML
jgi:hypothetical protein